jgi:PhzF family phenazine biosynthesis protein
MKLPIYQVDAFTSEIVKGNPAAVVPLEKWLPVETMQNIAEENNLAETAFFVWEEDHYHIRWFTPTVEVPLCGHATVASAYVIYNFLKPELETIRLQSKSGELLVTKEDGLISLNFPANKPEPVEAPQKLIDAVPNKPVQVLFNKSYLAIYENEQIIRQMKPDIRALEELHEFGLIISAKGDNYDFVSRFFVPGAGIDEDPVTGFAHTLLTPYWSEQLGKQEDESLPSVRYEVGKCIVENLENDRVKLSGRAVLFMKGEITI